MEITISKRDVIWSYIAQFFNLGAGFIVLPVVLRLLSAEEVGMNYLMLSVSSLVALADFGFAQQFGRNITYVFSGAQELKKEGMDGSVGDNINYHLLAVVIDTAKYIYKKISVAVLVTMITLGSLYMYRATDGFSTVHNSLSIWMLFSLSTYFNMYFMYYGSLLTGAAMIMESKKAIILNRLTYILITFALLFSGMGLMGIVVANIISPFVGRWYSLRQFYRQELRDALKDEKVSLKEIKEAFQILWYNAKKLGINFLGAYGIQQSGLIIIGLYLPLHEVASYGLMCQLFQIATGLALGVFSTLLPNFYKYRVEGDVDRLISDFSFSSYVFLWISIVCGAIIIFGGEHILRIIRSSTSLPVMFVMVIYSVHLLLENFHSICATMIVTNNKVPFVKAAIFSGIGIILCNIFTLQFTTLGLVGVVVGQFMVQAVYNHWKWPLWIFRELNIDLIKLTQIGHKEAIIHLRSFWYAE